MVDLQMSGDLDKVRDAILSGNRRYRTGSGKLYDAVAVAAGLFPAREEKLRRRAIVAVTDDVEQGSRMGMDALLRRLQEVDATLNIGVFVLGIPRRPTRIGIRAQVPRVIGPVRPRTGESLSEAVEATGGQVIPRDEFDETFPELIHRLRMRYLLGFYADPESTSVGVFYPVQVRLTAEAARKYPNSVIRARRGFYAMPTAQRVP